MLRRKMEEENECDNLDAEISNIECQSNLMLLCLEQVGRNEERLQIENPKLKNATKNETKEYVEVSLKKLKNKEEEWRIRKKEYKEKCKSYRMRLNKSANLYLYCDSVYASYLEIVFIYLIVIKEEVSQDYYKGEKYRLLNVLYAQE